MTGVSDDVARPIRGLTQGGAGYVLVDCLDEFTKWDPTTRQYGLAVIVMGTIVSAIQNFGENRGWWAAFLKKVPAKDVPVLDTAS